MTTPYKLTYSAQYSLLPGTKQVVTYSAQYRLDAYAQQSLTYSAQYALACYQRFNTRYSAQWVLDSTLYKQWFTVSSAQWELATWKNYSVKYAAQWNLPAYVNFNTRYSAQYGLSVFTPYTASYGAQWSLNTYQQASVVYSAQWLLDTYEQYYGWAINLNTQAISKFEGAFNINSLDGNLGTDSNGIYILEGDTDNGIAINGFVESGKLDFGENRLKTPVYAYLDVEGGPVTLNVETEDASIDYAFDQTTELESIRERLAMGVESRHIKVKLSNVAGSNAVIDGIDLLINVLPRSV